MRSGPITDFMNYDVELRRIRFFPDKTFRATRLETGHREGLRTGNGRVLPVPSIRLPDQICYPFLPQWRKRSTSGQGKRALNR